LEKIQDGLVAAKIKAFETKDEAGKMMQEGNNTAQEWMGTAKDKAVETKDATEEKMQEGKDNAQDGSN